MCPPTNNPTMNVPKLGKIILEDNMLVPNKYVRSLLVGCPTDLLVPGG